MPRLLALSTLIAAGFLTACSPLQQCLSAADQDSREIRRELDERRANLRYGYSIERVMAPELVPSFCPGPNGQPMPCTRWEQSTREIRHPINRAYEQERVTLLESQLARAGAQAATARAQCAATYPE